MENIRNTLTLGILAVILTTPLDASAYSRETHKGISGAILLAYERQSGDKFGGSEERALIQGGSDEDDDWRFMRHFYDPVNQVGLFGRYEASKYWALNTEAQANYECVGAWICYGDDVGYTDAYFSSPTDYSWDRAVYEYAWGDKVRGAAALGHVLHLIEDATVPAHVRNDAHPSALGIDIQADPYETYASQFREGTVRIPASIREKNFKELSFAFDDVANFTNKNFVSRDTLFAIYTEPSVKALRLSNGYLTNNNGDKIARAKGWVSLTGNVNITELYIDDEIDTVAADYWRVLSKKAIETGVGVIDLFFREVEKEKQTGVLKAKNTSAAERRAKDNAKKYFGVVKALYGSSLNQGDVEELLADASGQVGAAAAAVGSSEPIEPPRVDTPTPKPITKSELPSTQSELISDVSITESPVATDISTSTNATVSSSTPTVLPLGQALVPVVPGFGGGGGSGSTGESDPVPEADPEPVTLTVSTPIEGQFFSTSSVTFSGSTEANGVVTLTAASSTASTTADGSGNWIAALDLEEGNPTVSITTTDSVGDRATTTTLSLYIDLTPPSLAIVTLPQCANSLSSSFCLVATSSVVVSWQDVADASYYAVSINGSLTATTTATTSTQNITYTASSSIAIVTYDAAGNTSTSTSETVYAIERPVVLNEVAWAGTDAVDTDEWIELKNASSFDIDLEHVALQIDNATTSLSGTLSPGALYLVEDRAEATNKTHDLILDMSLSDTGAKLSLSDTDGTVMDETPDVSACSGWCAGSAAAVVGLSVQFGDATARLSMERIDSTVDGALSSNWRSNDTYIRADSSKALDSASNPIMGTPDLANSSGLANAGWDCGSGLLTTTGGAYNPSLDSCAYFSAFISTKANRYGDVFRGSVGSSTLVSGHSLSKSIRSDQTDTAITTGANPGDQFFVAMYEIRNGPAFNTELTDFRNYMQTGVGSAPHSNYVTIPWTYAP